MTESEILSTLAGLPTESPVRQAFIALIKSHQETWLSIAISPLVHGEERVHAAGAAHALAKLGDVLGGDQ